MPKPVILMPNPVILMPNPVILSEAEGSHATHSNLLKSNQCFRYKKFLMSESRGVFNITLFEVVILIQQTRNTDPYKRALSL